MYTSSDELRLARSLNFKVGSSELAAQHGEAGPVSQALEDLFAQLWAWQAAKQGYRDNTKHRNIRKINMTIWENNSKYQIYGQIYEKTWNMCKLLSRFGKHRPQFGQHAAEMQICEIRAEERRFFGPLHPAPLVVTTAPNIAQAVRAPRADLRPSPQVTFMHAKCEQRSTKNT